MLAALKQLTLVMLQAQLGHSLLGTQSAALSQAKPDGLLQKNGRS